MAWLFGNYNFLYAVTLNVRPLSMDECMKEEREKYNERILEK